MAKDEKPKTQSGTAAGTGKNKTGVDLAALVAAASSIAGTKQAKGPAFTQQDAVAYAQSIYQQMLGRNAVGAERTKAIGAFLGQSAETGVDGRQAAIENLIKQTPEFRNRQENRYLDAIYNAIEQDVRRAQA
jgi:hypothetical protein